MASHIAFFLGVLSGCCEEWIGRWQDRCEAVSQVAPAGAQD